MTAEEAKRILDGAVSAAPGEWLVGYLDQPAGGFFSSAIAEMAAEKIRDEGATENVFVWRPSGDIFCWYAPGA